jgi:hypothetical protein
MRKTLLALPLALAAAAALAGDAARALAWQPLAAARVGQRLRYEGTVSDTAGKLYDTYPLTVEVAAADEDEIRLAVAARGRTPKERGLPLDADAGAILDALGLLPPGFTAGAFRAVPASARLPGGKEVPAVRLAATGPVGGGAATATVEAVFARDVPLIGLVSATTSIAGGGAGISRLTLVEIAEPR